MWYFPYGIDIEKESVNNARLEHFKDNILESLAREVCQNSLDARVGEKPLLLEFSLASLNISDKIKSQQFIDEIIPLSKDTWKNDEVAQKFLQEYEKTLNKNEVAVLKISDYNTTGLIGSKWESLIENAGTSDKDAISSAGSFGIGKAAPFAASDLRMVFYNTQYQSDKKKSIGVVKFPSFNLEGNKIAQGVGYLGKRNKEPFLVEENFGFDTRHQDGTDIFIIGFNQTNNWEKRIIESMLSNFLLAIYNGDLEVKVSETVINQSNLNQHIKNLDETKYNQITKNYYDALTSEHKKLFQLDSRFEKFGFKPEDAYFIIATGEAANRSVLMTRKAGMKIYDRKGISGSIQFNGIFQAVGEDINQMLRKMENPNHDNWLPERYEENPRLAKELNLELFRFFKEKVTETFKEQIDEKVDAFGLNNFLPSRLNETKIKDKTKVESIDKENVKIKKKKKPKKQQQTSTNQVDGDVLYHELIKTGVIEGDGYGIDDSYSEGKALTKGDNTMSQTSGGLYEPNKDSEDIFNLRLATDVSNHFNLKIFELDYSRGLYLLRLNSKKSIQNLIIELLITGENGYNYKQNMVKASLDNKLLDIKENKVFIPQVSKNKEYIIELTIGLDKRVILGAKIYEN